VTEESELFAAEPDGAGAAYTNVRAADHQPLIDAKAHCENLWADFKPLADRQFLDRFPFDFHHRWFEMYTAVALKQAGFEVQSADFGPDIQTSIDGRQVWIECVCATGGEPGRPDSVPERVVTKLGDSPVVTRVPHEKIVLRLRNSLREKADKYTTYPKNGVVSPDDLLVVALNVHAVPHAWPDMEDFLMRSLYGVGNVVIRMSRDTGEVLGTDREHVASITKASGAEVGVLPFVDGSMGHITGVLGSRADAANRPARLGDDFDFFPNLTADQPWSGGIIKLGEEWSFEESEGEWTGKRASYLRDDPVSGG